MADESVPIGLKSFSADQPSGNTGNGSETCTAAMTGMAKNELMNGYVVKE